MRNWSPRTRVAQAKRSRQCPASRVGPGVRVDRQVQSGLVLGFVVLICCIASFTPQVALRSFAADGSTLPNLDVTVRGGALLSDGHPDHAILASFIAVSGVAGVA